MTNPLLLQALADEHRREQLAAANGSRLAALARCCHPRRLAKLIAALAAITKSHRPVPCCA